MQGLPTSPVAASWPAAVWPLPPPLLLLCCPRGLCVGPVLVVLTWVSAPCAPCAPAAALLLLRMQQAREEAQEAKLRSRQVGVMRFYPPACLSAFPPARPPARPPACLPAYRQMVRGPVCASGQVGGSGADAAQGFCAGPKVPLASTGGQGRPRTCILCMAPRLWSWLALARTRTPGPARGWRWRHLHTNACVQCSAAVGNGCSTAGRMWVPWLWGHVFVWTRTGQ